MVCRILMFMWSFGALVLLGSARLSGSGIVCFFVRFWRARWERFCERSSLFRLILEIEGGGIEGVDTHMSHFSKLLMRGLLGY